jgi:hypothetical protein
MKSGEKLDKESMKKEMIGGKWYGKRYYMGVESVLI